MEDFKFHKTKIAILDKRINSFVQGYRQNIAILGDDKHEISELIENYLEGNKLKELVYIHTNASYVDRKAFLKSISVSILSDYLAKHDTFDNLINSVGTSLTSTVNFIKESVKRASAPSFLEILEVINKFIVESGKKCVFIIEDLLALKKIFPNFHNDFSKFIILQRNCMVVLTSLHTREAEKTLYSDLNFLFGNFEKLMLGETNFFENYIYLKKALSPLPCSPFFISFFINILGHNSTYYGLAQQATRQIYRDSDEEASIVAIVQNLLSERQTYFFQKFIGNIDTIEKSFKDPSLTIKLLLALSEGYIRKKELLSLHLADSKELTARLQKLCDSNYIQNLGNIYKINDPLFSFWLTHIFEPAFCPSLCDKDRRSLAVEQKIRQAIFIFKEDFFKDKIKKVLELLNAFRNDSLKLGRTTYRLPLITKSRLMSYPEKNLHLLIGEGHEIVFVGIKESPVEDDDIFDFIEKGMVVKGRGVKKIFISLDTISASARLAAKNNKLTIWDVHELNDLMHIYQKPIITRQTQFENRTFSENFSNL